MKETAPSAERNKQPILDVLWGVLPPSGLVLEIGSGTGQHVAHFAQAMPDLVFQPTEMDTNKHASIEAWVEGLPNVRPPMEHVLGLCGAGAFKPDAVPARVFTFEQAPEAWVADDLRTAVSRL